MSEADPPADQAQEPPAPVASEEANEPESADGHDENADSWLRDDARARDAAGYGPILQEATDELSGSATRLSGGARSGVLIVGDVHISGDMLGGDKHAGEGRRASTGEVIAGEVSATVIKEIRRCYIDPPVYERLRDLLRERRVVLLRAPSGWGRTTTGLRLLSEMGTGTVHKLNPDTDLRGLNAEKDLKAGCGHLLEIRAMDQLAGLRIPHLEKLSAACLTHDVWVVVTVDEDIRLDLEVQGDFGIIGGDRPDLDVVLRRHLELRLGNAGVTDAAGSTAEVLTDPKVEEILGKFVNDTLSMHRLVTLADRLSLSRQNGHDLASVDAYFEQLSEHNFSAWFGAQTETEQLAFLIALATLNGMSYVVVSQAARDFEDRVHAVETVTEKAGRPVFGAGRASRLDLVRAATVPTTTDTQYGPTRVEGVRFLNDSYPGRVLERVWREHDGARTVILEWLRALGSDRRRTIRIRAAAAAGLLATFDFDRIHREILLPWAENNDPHVRESAVSALRFPLTQKPELAVHIMRMVRDWSGPHSPRNRQWTVARALGASIGRSFRSEALRLLRRLAAEDSSSVSFAVADSMMELFLGTEENAQLDVLVTLCRWTSDGAPKVRQATGMLSFLQLALHVSTEDSNGRTTWPGLLWFATRQDDQLPRLGLLWHRAVAAPGQFMIAQRAFAQWVTSAGDEPPVAEALDRLLGHAIRHRYDAGRFTEAVEQSMTDHGETDATRSLLTTISKLEKTL